MKKLFHFMHLEIWTKVPTSSMYHCSEGLVLNCCNCAVGRAHRDRVEWVRRQLDPPATFSLPDSVSKRAVVDKRSSLREESVKRYVHGLSEEFAHPKINVLHLPQHFSQLEARNTDDDNAKQQKRKIEYSSNCSQPLACAPVSHPVFKQAEERPVLHSTQRNHRCPRSNNAIFSLHNRAAGRGPYISYGRNLWTCFNRPERCYHGEGESPRSRKSATFFASSPAVMERSTSTFPTLLFLSSSDIHVDYTSG